MLSVECESCKAQYELDERRVPASGLKMRCPKCGHSFMVNHPGDGRATAPAATSAPALARDTLPSDFPAALGSLDESDLPVVSARLPPATALDLPARKPAAPPEATAPAADDLIDLPIVSADLPARAAPLPVMAPSLPVSAVPLPVAAAPLPAAPSALPAPAASLPVNAASLPARGFGEIELPMAAESLPSAVELDRHLPERDVSATIPEFDRGTFGEIDLPREAPLELDDGPGPPFAGKAPLEEPGAPDSSDFGDLQLEEHPRASRGGGSPVSRPEPVRAGGEGFGEVDFGGGSAELGEEASIGIDAAMPAPEASHSAPASNTEAAAEPLAQSFRPVAALPRPRPEAAPPKKRSATKLIAGGLLAAAVLGGAAMQLTQYGAFGYLTIGDRIHTKDYERATAAAIADTEKVLGADTYDAAKAASDALAAARARTPRDRPLAAYAAIVDYATTVRFGLDVTRASRAKQVLAELPPNEPVKYLDVAMAAQAAAAGQMDAARKALDAASRNDPNDPVQLEVALLLGEVELSAKDDQAAVAAFKRALALSDDARAHFGLARAYDRVGDAAATKNEIDATLAASPAHPGALTLRARRKSAPVDEAQALADLQLVLDGPARAKASAIELSAAYAAKAWVCLERGAASEAREAFDQATKLDPRNVEALNGEGRLLLNDGRSTEALSRFDTALQFDSGSPETIANDAEAKLALERLADAKQQLLEAKARFPKSLPILLLLGKVEQHLGNQDAAEADLRSAIAFVDPARRDAVLPYVALSELLSARGRLSEATATLHEAKKRLPPSSALDRAFGEVAELQGQYATAIAHYRSALGKDPKDVATRFRIAVVLRRLRKFGDAGVELDTIAAVDKDYPGLSLERGLLFEESGDVAKAIEQFKNALAKAPDDPDLQLRVGSAYVAIERPDDALPMLRKVLEKRPTSAEANHYIGRALTLKGSSEHSDALRYLKRAVDLDPNRAEFHVYLAWAANDAQPAQLELARDEIDKALALDKLDAEAYWQKGVLERMEGAINDSIKDERRALELRPSRYEAHATLAECYEDKNDERTAMGEWTKAIAGDGSTLTADGTVPHPYWHYRFGKLLVDKGRAGSALAHLSPASAAAEKMTPRPGWLAPLEFLTAEALRKTGRKADAVEHYRRFLDIAPVNSPDRLDAQTALGRLTGEH